MRIRFSCYTKLFRDNTKCIRRFHSQLPLVPSDKHLNLRYFYDVPSVASLLQVLCRPSLRAAFIGDGTYLFIIIILIILLMSIDIHTLLSRLPLIKTQCKGIFSNDLLITRRKQTTTSSGHNLRLRYLKSKGNFLMYSQCQCSRLENSEVLSNTIMLVTTIF